MQEFLNQMSRHAKTLGGQFYQICAGTDTNTYTVPLTPGNACQNSYSVAKAFAVTAVGLLWDRGMLDLSERIADIFSSEIPAIHDPKWDSMTVHHVLKHSCGFPKGYLDIDEIDCNCFGTDDYLSYLFATTLDYLPGTASTYSDAAYYLISRIVTKKCGLYLDEFLWKELFYPLGFREMAWSKCPLGYPMGATGLYIYTKDMIKLGQLYASGGMYLGKRILSEEWVKLVLDREYEFHRICNGAGYAKGGAFGQMLAFYPECGCAVAWHSYQGGDLLDWLEKNYHVLLSESKR